MLSLAFLPIQQSKARDSADDILSQVYGSISTVCSQDADADTGEHNRLTGFTAGRRYVVYCHDGAGAGVACECIVGGATIDASAAVGMTMFAGEKVVIKFWGGNTAISCVPFVANQLYDVCPLD